MNRILFAAARGARVQYDWYGDWLATSLLPTTEGSRPHRIHPDDEAMQYGPISTVLRESVGSLYDNHYGGVTIDQMGVYHLYTSDSTNFRHFADSKLHRDLFLLLLAEALADEGL